MSEVFDPLEAAKLIANLEASESMADWRRNYGSCASLFDGAKTLLTMLKGIEEYGTEEINAAVKLRQTLARERNRFSEVAALAQDGANGRHDTAGRIKILGIIAKLTAPKKATPEGGPPPTYACAHCIFTSNSDAAMSRHVRTHLTGPHEITFTEGEGL